MEFFLKRNKAKTSDDKGVVYARVYAHKVTKLYSIKYRITEEEWFRYQLHDYNSRTRMPSLDITYDMFSTILENIKHYFDNKYVHKDAKYKIKQIKIETLYSPLEGQAIIGNKGNFLDVYTKKYYNELVSGERLKYMRGVEVSKDYAKLYKNLFGNILKFQYYQLYRFRLEDINMEFQREFVSWMKKQKLSPNTIHAQLKRINTLMKRAFEEDVTENDITRYHSFVTREIETEEVYLTLEQINTVYNLDLSSFEVVEKLIKKNISNYKQREEELDKLSLQRIYNLSICRDIFVVGCLTGQRFSDFIRINSDMLTRIKDTWFINIVQQKTEKKVYIPLEAKVKIILDRYRGKLPDVKYNFFLTHLDRLFNYIGWTWNPGFQRIESCRMHGERFCDMITTRTARRSFATNAYTSGIKVSSIMAVTGHSTEVIFRRYIKLDTEDKALKAAQNINGFMKL